MSKLHRVAMFALVLAAAGGSGHAFAQTTAGRAADDTVRHPAAPVLQQYCFRCHGAQTQTAGVNFDGLIAQRPLVRNREAWTRAIDAVEIGKMPPAGAPQPSDAERETLHALLSDSIDNFDYSTVDNPGYEPAKRLTHRELDNTLRDLLGANFTLTDRFPAELAGASGFDNTANTLFLESTLMERYIAAAEGVVELMLPSEPATEAERRAHELVFIATPGGGLGDEEAAELVLRHFLGRAYRRPPGEADVARALGQYRAARQSAQAFEDAVKVVLQAILISPKFLLRVETPPETADPEPYRISDWDLAARLSYFLWSSMPDAELRDLARRGELSDPAVLEAQVDRMLADPKADTLGTSFAAQWLGFQQVGSRIWLDPIDNPWCTDTLMTAMRDESSMFFLSLIRDNQPIRRLIDADYTFVNEELGTTLYGMEGIEGEHMRRVPLDDPQPRRLPRTRQRPRPDLELQGHQPRQARPLRPRRAARHAAATAAAGRRRALGGARRPAQAQLPREAGDALQQPDLQRLPQPHRPDRLQPGELRLLRPLARQLPLPGARGDGGRGRRDPHRRGHQRVRAEALLQEHLHADRSRRIAAERHRVRRPGRAQEHPAQ